MENSYLLATFCSLLIATTLAGRLWGRLTGAQLISRRDRTTLFVYEFAVLFLGLLATLRVSGIEISFGESFKPTPDQERAVLMYIIGASTHLFWFFFSIGARAGVSFWKRLWTSLLVGYLLVFLWGVGVALSVPFFLLPLFILLYPIYALLRDWLPWRGRMRVLLARLEETLTSA
jgi:hypothetical protein